jgi:transcription elongation GreA/GreB family factor
MNKTKLVEGFIQQLESDLLMMKEAARATYEAATGEESKPENEYDTRGLEASYLAGAQAKRAAEIDEVLTFFKNLKVQDFSDKDAIQMGSLVGLQSQGKKSHVFVVPKGGGVSLTYEGKTVQLITPVSAIGEAIVGMKVGDEIEVEVGDHVREYEILSHG